MHHLLLLLGAGPSNAAQVKAREYRKATYFLPDAPEERVETPFVGEAILSLHPRRFDHVHVFGTPTSMWESLYHHALPPEPSDEQDERLETLLKIGFGERAFSEENEGDGDPPEALGWVADRFAAHTGVDASCHLIPPGRSEGEFWEMLRATAGLGITRGALSIDVTHGLRSQPLFLLLALLYLRSAYEDVRMGSVFYGAQALAKSDFDGRTPLFDLRPMLELVDWTDAAQAFDRYGDAAPLAELLRTTERGDGPYEHLAGRAEDVSQRLQLNVFDGFPRSLSQFGKALSKAQGHGLLDLIRPRLKRLSGKLKGQREPWAVLLGLARHHWDHYQAGLAVLVAWEAVIERMAAVFERDDKHETHSALGWAARRRSKDLFEHVYTPGDLEEFPYHTQALRRFRNNVAHDSAAGDQRLSSPGEVYGEFPEILCYLEDHLSDPYLDRIADHHTL